MAELIAHIGFQAIINHTGEGDAHIVGNPIGTLRDRIQANEEAALSLGLDQDTLDEVALARAAKLGKKMTRALDTFAA
jgi:hypothetical protein